MHPLGTAFSIVWRAVLLQLVFALVVVLAMSGTTLLTEPRLAPIKVSGMYMGYAVALYSVQVVSKRSLLSFIFGSRVSSSPQFWGRVSFGVAAYWLLFALINYVVAQSFDFATWVTFKTFLPLPTFILFVIATTPWFLRRGA